jgi:hypothetical protein
VRNVKTSDNLFLDDYKTTMMMIRFGFQSNSYDDDDDDEHKGSGRETTHKGGREHDISSIDWCLWPRNTFLVLLNKH